MSLVSDIEERLQQRQQLEAELAETKKLLRERDLLFNRMFDLDKAFSGAEIKSMNDYMTDRYQVEIHLAPFVVRLPVWTRDQILAPTSDMADTVAEAVTEQSEQFIRKMVASVLSTIHNARKQYP